MKIAVVTDSNSGITQAQGKELGITVLPMPFMIDGNEFFEDISLTQQEFYGKMEEDMDISTSQPSPESIEMCIRDRFREGYVSTFDPPNVIREYERGNHHLRYDFQMSEDADKYFWMRIDAYVFYSAEDDSIHMFTYRKNIEEEKKIQIQAVLDLSLIHI